MIWALWFTLANYRGNWRMLGIKMDQNPIQGRTNTPSLFLVQLQHFSSYSYSHYTSVTLPHSLTYNNLYSYQVAHAARAYPGFHSMERLGVSLLPPPPPPPNGKTVHRNVTPSISSGFPSNSLVPIYTRGLGEALWEDSVLPKITTQCPSQVSTRCPAL